MNIFLELLAIVILNIMLSVQYASLKQAIDTKHHQLQNFYKGNPKP